MTSRPRCAAKTMRGRRCEQLSGLALQDDGTYRCLWHDPARKGKARAMRRKGGIAGGKARWERATPPPPPKTAADAVAYASWLMYSVVQGDLDSKRAAVAVRALSEFNRSLDAHEMAKRYAKLEAQLATFKQGDAASDR